MKQALSSVALQEIIPAILPHTTESFPTRPLPITLPFRLVLLIMEGQPLLLPSTPIPRLWTLENRAVYLYALEELVRPDLVSVLPSVRTVNAIVEMGHGGIRPCSKYP